VDRRPELERLAPTTLSIVNFRYLVPGGAAPERVDAVNRQIVNRLVGSGSFFLAPTILKGRASLRVCIVNFRTSEEDLVFLLDEVRRVGGELVGGR